MSDRETNLRSIVFVIIGVLLLLSLIICIYLTNGEKDLVPIDAKVINVKKDSDGTGKNDVIVTYDVNNVTYEYRFYYRDDVNVDDKITIYYHENNVTSVQTFKTSKFIFICPIVGLLLCAVGLFELFRKHKEDEDDLEDFNTKTISIIGNTQQLEIITDDGEVIDYVKTPEEEEETPVKNLNVKTEVVEEEQIKIETRNENKSSEEVEVKEIKTLDDILVNSEEKTEKVEEKEKTKDKNKEDKKENKHEKQKLKEDRKIPIIGRKEKNNEPKKEEVKKLVTILPKSYYMSGNTLVYEETGKELEEITLLEVQRILKTVNSAGEIVKITIFTEDKKCVLTKMRKSNLEETYNLLYNKMVGIYSTYKEEIEYKEY